MLDQPRESNSNVVERAVASYKLGATPRFKLAIDVLIGLSEALGNMKATLCDGRRIRAYMAVSPLRAPRVPLEQRIIWIPFVRRGGTTEVIFLVS